MNALNDSANTDRRTLYEDSTNFLKDERFTKTEYQTSANLRKMNAEDTRITKWVSPSKWGKTLNNRKPWAWQTCEPAGVWGGGGEEFYIPLWRMKFHLGTGGRCWTSYKFSRRWEKHWVFYLISSCFSFLITHLYRCSALTNWAGKLV